MIQNRRPFYIALSVFGFVLVVAANTLTPSAVYAERIPFAIQNVTQSSPDGLGEGLYQIAVLLPEREDGKFYHGQLTYTASVPVEVQIPQPPAGNASGTEPLGIPGFNATITSLFNATITSLDFDEPKHFNSVTFAGTELVLFHRSTEPFTVSYSIVGEALDPEPLP